MVSRFFRTVLGIGVSGVLIGALLGGLSPQAQEAGDREADQVTPSELQLYIDVYSAMQADHGLQIETVLAQKGVSLSQFRNIEQRVQKQERLVRKVREALMTQAKVRAEAVAPAGMKAETTPASPTPQH